MTRPMKTPEQLAADARRVHRMALEKRNAIGEPNPDLAIALKAIEVQAKLHDVRQVDDQRTQFAAMGRDEKLAMLRQAIRELETETLPALPEKAGKR